MDFERCSIAKWRKLSGVFVRAWFSSWRYKVMRHFISVGKHLLLRSNMRINFTLLILSALVKTIQKNFTFAHTTWIQCQSFELHDEYRSKQSTNQLLSCFKIISNKFLKNWFGFFWNFSNHNQVNRLRTNCCLLKNDWLIVFSRSSWGFS
jgi:hypothetical protein